MLIRIYAENCQECKIEGPEDNMRQEIARMGKLTLGERQKLLVVSRHCSIHRILSHRAQMESRLVDVPQPAD